jgi:tRNA-Thr(GGU) m(6)t(6)A37 methyltransferase TsaA
MIMARIADIKQIGIIHSPYKTTGECPNQAYKSKQIAEIEVFKEYEEGLDGIEGFSHLVILWLFHKSKGHSLKVVPFYDHSPRGLFATRSPRRPNPIGISVVRLIERRGNKLKVKGIDMVDGTPLIDIKPYVPEFDEKTEIKIGWLEGKIGRR